MRLFQKNRIGKEKEIKILGISIIQYGEKYDSGVKEKYLSIFPRPFYKRALDLIFKIDELCNYKEIYLNKMRLGETFLLTQFIEEWYKVNKSKNPAVVCFHPYCIDIFKMFAPQIKCFLYTDKQNIKLIYDNIFCNNNKKYMYKDKEIYTFTNYSLLDKIFKHHQHIYSSLLDYCKVKNVHSVLYNIDNNKKKEIIDNLLSKNVILDKLILIFPDAYSSKTIQEAFWIKIVEMLEEKGYSVLINTKNPVFTNYNKIYYNLEYTYILSTLAKHIIGLRSGIFDILSQVNTDLRVIYSPFTGYIEKNAKDNMEVYSLKFLPNAKQNNIKEYIYDKNNEQKLINSLLKGL